MLFMAVMLALQQKYLECEADGRKSNGKFAFVARALIKHWVTADPCVRSVLRDDVQRFIGVA